MYEIGQNIVYPTQGVGLVMEIQEKSFNNKTVKYYKIYIRSTDIVVLVPVDTVASFGIRPIVSAEDARAAVDQIAKTVEPVQNDWKVRYQENLALLKSGSIFDIVKIVCFLYNRSKIKDLPTQERKFFDSAKRLLQEEVAVALNISEDEAVEMIHTELEALCSSGETSKPPVDMDMDDGFDMGDDVFDDEDDGEDDDDDDDEDD